MRKGGFDKGIVLILVMVVVLLVTGVSVALALRSDDITDLVAADERLSLLLAIELSDGRLISHTLFYQFSTRRGALFHIPSHTGVVVRSLDRVDSIDTVFFTDGPAQYAHQVADLLGVSVPYYLHLDEDGVAALIDLLGGVQLFVTDLPDEGPDAVRIPHGDVVLDGAKALEYLSYEGEGERERDRLVRRQKLVVSLLEEIGRGSPVLADRRGSRIAMSTLDTNMDRPALVSLMREFGELERERLITREIEGASRRVVAGDVEKMLLFPHQEGRWLRESVRQIIENLASLEAVRDENIVIRIEILNGTSVIGLASRTAELFRSYGFDVIAVGNAPASDVERTMVVDRVGSDVFARRAADIIRASRLDSDLDPQAVVDVTVILGRDFDGRYVR